MVYDYRNTTKSNSSCNKQHSFYTSGSGDQVAALAQAERICFRKPATPIGTKEDMEFKFIGESCKTGEITVTLKVKNDSVESRVEDVYITAVASYYTGVSAVELKETSPTIVIEPSGGEIVVLSNLKTLDLM